MGEKKKIVERSEPRSSLGRGMAGRPFPFPRSPLGSLRSLIFFQFDPVYIIGFSPVAELGPRLLTAKIRWLLHISTSLPSALSGSGFFSTVGLNHAPKELSKRGNFG